MWSGYSEKGQGAQEKGPSSFSIDSPGVPTARAAGELGNIKAGLNGGQIEGNTARSIQLTDPGSGSDKTLGLLLKLGESLIRPELELIKQRQFVEGMTRAASGQALTEIVNEQPAFSRVFGTDPMVEGAQAYSVQAQSTAWATEQEMNMGELRKRSPAEIPGYIVESMGKFMTGDPNTDALIKANVGKQAPGVVKRHTKENFAYMQQKASDSRMSLWEAGATSIKAMSQAGPDMYTPEERSYREQELLASMVPTPGANEESWLKDVEAFMGSQAESGNFHAINTLRRGGVIANMDTASRTKAEARLNQYAAYHASQAAAGYADQIAEIRFNANRAGTMSVTEVQAQYAAINADYTARSGNQVPIVSKAEVVRDSVGAASRALDAKEYLIKQAQNQAKESAQIVDSATKEVALVQSFELGQAHMAAANGHKESDVKEAFYKSWASKQGDPVQAATLLVRNGIANYTNPLVKSELAKLVNTSKGEQYTDNFRRAYDSWASINAVPNGGNAVAADYFDERTVMQMQEFRNALNGRDINKFGEQAYQRAKLVRTGTDPLSKEDAKSVKGYLDGPFYGADPAGKLDPVSQTLLMSAMGTAYKSLKGVAMPDRLNDEALARARADGVEIVGGRVWRRDKAQAPLTSYFLSGDDPATSGLTEDQLGEDLNSVVKERLQLATGGDAENVQLLRMADQQGKATFQVIYTNDGKLNNPLVIDTDDLKAHRRGIRNKQAGIVQPTFNPSGGGSRAVSGKLQ